MGSFFSSRCSGIEFEREACRSRRNGSTTRKNNPVPMTKPNPIPKTISPTLTILGVLLSTERIVAVNCIRSPAFRSNRDGSWQQSSPALSRQWRRWLGVVGLVCALTQSTGVQSAGVQSTGAQSTGTQSAGAQSIKASERNLEASIQGLENKIWAQAQDLPGAAAVLVINGKVRPLMLHGFQAMNDIQPVSAQTVFQLASLSKSFAATAIALAVDDGQLDWGTPISALLPELKWSDARRCKKLKLFHLANQSSGLMPHAYTNLVEDVASYESILSRLHQVPFICDPGACYSYQNVVFSLLGEALTQATGLSYANYVQQRIFEPLNMQTASVGVAGLADDRWASAHVSHDERWVVVPHSQRYYKVAAAAGVNASILDLQQWLLAHLGLVDGLPVLPLATLQSRYIVNDRSDNHYPNDDRITKVGYGLGWRVFSFSGLDGFTHHGGYLRGMRSEMIFHRASSSGLVFLTNSEPAKLNRLSLAFAEWLVAQSGPSKR